MPRKQKLSPVELPVIPAELLKQFGNGSMTVDAINTALLALKEALIERALDCGTPSRLRGESAVKPGSVTNQRTMAVAPRQS